MTDDAELIARLLGAAQTDTNRQLLNDAAYALEQRTRTITALEGQLAELSKRDKIATFLLSNPKDIEIAERLAAANAVITAADQRARTAEATTWEQAAEYIVEISEDRLIADAFRRRAHAAREEQTHAPNTQG
jgi:uncharacterized protein with von Willebrand factor type A (vWA) domain